MLNSDKFLEKYLQTLRFKKISEYLEGDVLDFGGNKGELKKFVKGKYYLINYDHSKIETLSVDTIVSLAVIEHIEISKTHDIFSRFYKILNKNGKLVITTPTVQSKNILNSLAYFRILDSTNIKKHKHY